MSKKNLGTITQVILFKANGCYKAWCPSLNLTVIGVTMPSSLKLMKGSQKTFLSDLNRKGILISTLIGLGWSIGNSPGHLLIPPYYNNPKLLLENLGIKLNNYVTVVDLPIELPSSVNSLLAKSRINLTERLKGNLHQGLGLDGNEISLN